jgi:hypothetical protein
MGHNMEQKIILRFRNSSKAGTSQELPAGRFHLDEPAQLKHRLEVASSQNKADAIMRCELYREEGGHKVTNVTGRILGTKGHESAIVRVYDRSGHHVSGCSR